MLKEWKSKMNYHSYGGRTKIEIKQRKSWKDGATIQGVTGGTDQTSGGCSLC